METDTEEKLAALVDDPAFQTIDRRLRRFNLFEAIGVVKRELSHSNFLAFILSPARPHGFGAELLLRVLCAVAAKVHSSQRKIRVLELVVADLDGAVIHRERDNIDLLMEVKELRLCLTIENKIDASVGSGQLARYKKIVKQRFPEYRHLFVLLTPETRQANDPDYIALGYTELAEIIDNFITERSETLSTELSLILRHYVEMLRRNIVEDPKLEELARQLYEKHKEAFDFVEKVKPQPKNLLDDIRKLLDSNSKLTQDRHAPALLRFVPDEWNSFPQLNSCPSSEWTRTGRSLLFEVKAHSGNRITVALVLGPSEPTTVRRQIYDEAAKRNQIFVGLVKPMGHKWSSIYNRELLAASEAKAMSQVEQVEAIEVAWQNFVESDLPVLTKEVPKILESIR